MCHLNFHLFYFLLQIFSWIIFPQAPENNTSSFQILSENLRKYSQVKGHQQYQRHRWQILPPVPLVLMIPGANLPPVSTILAANLPPVSPTPVVNCQRYQRHLRQICHRCQQHRWQTMGTISDYWQLKVNLKEKIYLYANSTTQRCPKEIMKTFLIEDFFHLTLVVHLELRISPRIFKKIWNGLNAIIRGWPTLHPQLSNAAPFNWAMLHPVLTHAASWTLCHTAPWTEPCCTLNWATSHPHLATLHPPFPRCTLLFHAAPCWAMPYPYWARLNPYWATPHPQLSHITPFIWATLHPVLIHAVP